MHSSERCGPPGTKFPPDGAAADADCPAVHGQGEGDATITTDDDVEVFYKDWGSGQPIVFSQGWPLTADDWDTQMLFFVGHGYRVIAHDRRRHGRSTHTADGHDMDHNADDLAALVAHLDLHDAVHVGHSTAAGRSRVISRATARVGRPGPR